MSGFGSVQVMNEMIKANRALLKRHRKTIKELAKDYKLKGTNHAFNFKQFTPEEMKVFKVALHLKRRRERRIKLSILCGLALLLGFGISLLFV